MIGLQRVFFLANVFCAVVGFGMLARGPAASGMIGGLVLSASGIAVVAAIVLSWISRGSTTSVLIAAATGGVMNVALLIFGVLGLVVAQGIAQIRLALFTTLLSLANLYILKELWRRSSASLDSME